MQNAMLNKSEVGIKTAGRNINFRYADVTTLTAESKKELECLLMGVEEGSEKTGLKLNIQKAKIMAFGPITSWQILGKKWKQETNFLSLGSKITADSDCSYEINRCLILGRKAVTNLDSVLKSRDIPLPTKVFIVKAIVSPVVTDGWESGTAKKTEC